MANFEEHVNAPRPAEGVVALAGPSVALRGTSGPGTVASPRDQEPPPLRDLAAAEPASQSAAVTPPAALGSRSKLAGQRALGDPGFGYRRIRTVRYRGILSDDRR
jgi:hypothetical protein